MMRIFLQDVCFSYGQKKVLQNINLSVDAGDHIGIIGMSGCGKSTLLKLLSGLYTPTSGHIEVAGANSPQDIRRQVSMVMQSAMLLPASIRENITCGHSISAELVLHACEAAQLIDWIRTLRNGIDTDVGERGSMISGGQAQRIAIARAIAKDAPVILLDEATSALDKETGDAVLSALSNLTKNRTVVSVSHNPQTMANFKSVYRLDGGRLFHA